MNAHTVPKTYSGMYRRMWLDARNARRAMAFAGSVSTAVAIRLYLQSGVGEAAAEDAVAAGVGEESGDHNGEGEVPAELGGEVVGPRCGRGGDARRDRPLLGGPRCGARWG